MRLRKTPHKLSPYGSIVVLTPERLATSWVEALPELAQMPTAPSPPLSLARPPFRSFFSLSHREISFFLLSLGGLLVEFWWCLLDGTLKCAFTFGLFGCCVKSRRLWGRQGPEQLISIGHSNFGQSRLFFFFAKIGLAEIGFDPVSHLCKFNDSQCQ